MSRVKHYLVATVLGISLITVALLCSLVLTKPPLYPPYIEQSQAIYDRDGNLLRLKLASDQRYRMYLEYDELPQSLIDATLLYEDRWFYQHNGVNPAAIWRAIKTSYFGGGRRVGASTITMQAARMRFQLRSASVWGKMRQIWHAWQLEWHYEKSEILALYFNLAPYGGNVESAAAASLVWLDKPLSQITTGEALSLSVIPQNPAKRYPGNQAGRLQIEEARQRLLAIWLEQNPEDQSKRTQLELSPVLRSRSELPYHAPHFVQQLPSQPGAFITTLNLSHQTLLEYRLQDYVNRHRSQGLRNASALLLNTETMEIEALVGSADFNNSEILGQVDGTLAQRSPGSTLKPFVYALAIDAGIIHPRSLLEDAPKRYGAYTPENFDKKFSGPIHAENALVFSRNLPAVNLLAQLQETTDYGLYELLQQAEVANLKAKDFYGLALTLGGNEISMIELAQLYAMLANNGHWQAVKRIKDSDNDDNDQLSQPNQQLLSAEASWLIRDILAKNPPPKRVRLAGQAKPSYDVSWKTGTSWAHRDAWAAGIVGPYVLVVWAGNFNGEGNPFLVGRKAAAPLFFEMVEALSKTSAEPFGNLGDPPANLNLSKVEVCSATGDLPNPACPSSEKTWFIPGVSPIKMSTIHQQIPVYADSEGDKSGKRACLHKPPHTELLTFELWPSHIQKLYRNAGLGRKQPPPFAEPCSNELLAGNSPSIVSPDKAVSYSLAGKNKTIPFIANTAADATTLYWFVNNRFVGESNPSSSLLWRAHAGVHTIAVSDQLGRSSQTLLRVAD